MTRAEVRRVLSLVSSPAFRSMQVPPVPSDYCCDRFAYAITVRYADGSVRHLATAAGLDWPAPLEQLLENVH